ncbi:hypothetical protein M2158_005376 [Streptomyces sp. SAI-144]|nr:hypothetical protein [Streptomyces sp. SAI-144]
MSVTSRCRPHSCAAPSTHPARRRAAARRLPRRVEVPQRRLLLGGFGLCRRPGDILEYLEDPALGTPALAEGAARTNVPLATNMCMTTFAEIKEAFTRDAVQMVLCDHHYGDGLRNTQQLAAICRTFGVGLSMHSNTHLGISPAAMTHVASTVPGLHHACDSHCPWQSEDILTERLTFEDGSVKVSDAPGPGCRTRPRESRLPPPALAGRRRFAARAVRRGGDAGRRAGMGDARRAALVTPGGSYGPDGRRVRHPSGPRS